MMKRTTTAARKQSAFRSVEVEMYRGFRIATTPSGFTGRGPFVIRVSKTVADVRENIDEAYAYAEAGK